MRYRDTLATKECPNIFSLVGRGGMLMGQLVSCYNLLKFSRLLKVDIIACRKKKGICMKQAAFDNVENGSGEPKGSW